MKVKGLFDASLDRNQVQKSRGHNRFAEWVKLKN